MLKSEECFCEVTVLSRGLVVRRAVDRGFFLGIESLSHSRNGKFMHIYLNSAHERFGKPYDVILSQYTNVCVGQRSVRAHYFQVRTYHVDVVNGTKG